MVRVVSLLSMTGIFLSISPHLREGVRSWGVSTVNFVTDYSPYTYIVGAIAAFLLFARVVASGSALR